MSILPNWIKRLLWSVFLSFWVVLLWFAIGWIFNLLPESPSDSLVETVEADYPENAVTATFAAWCFWCTEAAFQEEPWVLDAISGFAGWTQPNPTYEQVVSWKTDYREWVQVTYNPDLVSYERLLDIFRESIDPTDAWGQFVDRWFQYTTAIFTHDAQQKQLAEESLLVIQEVEEEAVAPLILPYTTFYPAEEYHQDFYKNSKQRYEQYRNNSGREIKESEIWREENGPKNIQDSPQGIEPVIDEENIRNEWDTTTLRSADWFVKPTQEELKEQLSFMQYRVSQNDGTEPPFANAYWDNKEDWIYVDIVSWEPLFSSKDQYKSGTWRPSFTQPIGWVESVITLHEDTSLRTTRTEVRSAVADSHLGHLFDDGPVDRGGLRYCMNSASMRFVAYEEMNGEWYGEWMEFVR
jgi:peptide methionine sulfoxide reductase msrA/msrB